MTKRDIADTDCRYSLHGYVESGGLVGLVELLREFGNPVTNQIAEMLDPHADTYWKLVLRRRRRGNPSDGPMVIAFEYEEALEKYGDGRGAIKRAEWDVAVKYKLTPAGVRSAVRRASGTHGGRRKRGRGRK